MFTALLLTTAFAAPVPKVKVDVPYFPTTVGTKWVMKSTRKGESWESTEEVTAVEERDGVFRVTVDWRGGRHAHTTVYEVSTTNVVDVDGRRETLLDLGVKPGASWECKLEGIRGAVVTTTYTLGKEEEVSVLAGRFKAVPVVREIGKYKTTLWYAPGVGVVKTEELGEDPFTQELKSFTLGNDAKK